MDYANFSKEQLIQMIEERKLLNGQLPGGKGSQLELDFSWADNLGLWYWNVQTNEVTFNPLKATKPGLYQRGTPGKGDLSVFYR